MGVLLFLLFLFRLHFPAVLPLILYGLLPLWPGVGAEGTFSLKSKAFSTTIRSLILDPSEHIFRQPNEKMHTHCKTKRENLCTFSEIVWNENEMTTN